MNQLITDWLNRTVGIGKYDFFICYARADASNYVLSLHERLNSKGYTSFLDKVSIPAGESLTESGFMPFIERGLRRSRAIILVGTERAFHSRYVSTELEMFLKKKNRRVLAISASGSLLDVNVSPFDRLRGLMQVEEKLEAIKNGQPSESVLRHLQLSVDFNRRHVIMLRGLINICLVMFTLGLIVGLILCMLWTRS